MGGGMSNYNDGKWHGWNGGECPVRPETIVEYVWMHGRKVGIITRKAGFDDMDTEPAWRSQIIAFRVIKEYREPREWWLRLDVSGNISGTDEEQSPPPNWDPARTIRVREVIE